MPPPRRVGEAAPNNKRAAVNRHADTAAGRRMNKVSFVFVVGSVGAIQSNASIEI
jgi:hypothetical protein